MQTVRLSEPTATTVEDELGRKRLVIIAMDAHGKVWVNPDALGGGDWQRVSNKVAVESQ